MALLGARQVPQRKAHLARFKRCELFEILQPSVFYLDTLAVVRLHSIPLGD